MNSVPTVPAPRRVGTRGASAFLFCSLVAAAAAGEQLDRGVVAFPTREGGVYVGWRLLAEDASGQGFDVYRGDQTGGRSQKLNTHPITGSTNFVDRTAAAGGAPALYSVRPAGGKTAGADRGAVRVEERVDVGGMRRIKLQGNYKAQKVGVADLDGDGKFDYLVKHPDFNVDPYVLGEGYWKPSPEPYKLEAYRHDGTFMWRHDMGPAIETGGWYAPIVVYDIDGDGK